MPPPSDKKQEVKDKEITDLPVIKDDYGYIVNPYVPKFIAKTPWYAEKINEKQGKTATSSTVPFLRKDQPDTKSESRTYDEKHDRWHKYDESDWKPQEIKGDASSSADKEKITTIDPYSRTCSRNLRIREDVAKYLDKSNTAIAESYDPKSRSIGIRESSKEDSRGNFFAWDESRIDIRKKNSTVSTQTYGPNPNKANIRKDDRRYNY